MSKRRKVAIYPTNDAAEYSRQNPNDTGAGGSRKNPDDGVKHLPDGYSATADKAPDRLPKNLKAVILVLVGGKKLASFEEINENLRRISDLQLDFRYKVFRSKKHNKIVLMHLATLPEARKTELEMICNQVGLPVLFLDQSKKKLSHLDIDKIAGKYL